MVALAFTVALLSACGGGTSADSDGVSDASRAPAGAEQPAPGDWPTYNRTLEGDRFSPLDDINRGNVASLREICAYELPRVTSLQVGPIVIDGTMYFTTDTHSYAIDAATCAQKWTVEHALSQRSAVAAQRGFAFLDGRLFRGTADGHVLALDAADGHTLWNQAIDDMAPGVTMPMAPIAADGLVFIAHAGGDQTGVTGHA